MVTDAWNGTPDNGISFSNYNNGVLTIRITGGIEINIIPAGSRSGAFTEIVAFIFRGLMVDKSSKKFSEKRLIKMAKSIENQLMKSFTGIDKSQNIEWLMDAEVNTVTEGIMQSCLMETILCIFTHSGRRLSAAFLRPNLLSKEDGN